MDMLVDKNSVNNSSRILVVEDETLIAIDLKNTLKSFGYSVVSTVATGEEAVEAVQQDPHDLILMDIKLGGRLDGVESAELIQAHCKIPVVFLTSYADESYLERAQYIFPYCFLIKPYVSTQLQTTIKLALNVARIERERSRVNRELAQKNRQFEQFFNMGMDLFCIMDREGIIHKLNREWVRCLDRPLFFLERKNILNFTHPDDYEGTRTAIHDLGEIGTVKNFLNRVRTNDGSYRWLEWRAQAVDKGLIYAVARDITGRKVMEQEREQLINQLRQAVEEIKTLQGFIPICSSCKKIRDDEGYWQRIEKYIQDRSDARFTHSICPDCLKKQYPDLYLSLEDE